MACPSSSAMCQCFPGEEQQFVPPVRAPDECLADEVEDANSSVLWNSWEKQGAKSCLSLQDKEPKKP